MSNRAYSSSKQIYATAIENGNMVGTLIL